MAATIPRPARSRTLYQLCADPRLNHRVDVEHGILAEECATLLKDFFRTQRGAGEEVMLQAKSGYGILAACHSSV